jgi:hypothetical protein
MKTTRIIAGLIVSALVSTTGVFATNNTSTGMTTPTTAKVAHTKKVVKKVVKRTISTAAKKTTKKVDSVK